MIKQGLKNFTNSLKYIFTPLGAMFLGIMVGLSILIPGIAVALSTLSNGIKTLSSNFNLDIGVLLNDIWSSIRSLDWSDPIGSIKTIFSSAWINNNLMQVLNSMLGTDFETFKSQIGTLVGNFTLTVIINAVLFAILLIVGFIVGFCFTEFQMRKDIKKKSFGKMLLETFINGLFSILLIVVAIFLLVLWRWSIIISLLLMLLIISTFALLEDYIMRGNEKKPLKSVFNFDSVKYYVLTNAIIYLITIAITIIGALINFMMGMFIGLALFQIAHITISINAQVYVDTIGDETNE
ncbi:MAG: hypothetical protein J1F32_01330 [Erysipelotrichales bacterium]|nr:hypothetical protein [Erysipelotrichales bacterium]